VGGGDVEGAFHFQSVGTREGRQTSFFGTSPSDARRPYLSLVRSLLWQMKIGGKRHITVLG